MIVRLIYNKVMFHSRKLQAIFYLIERLVNYLRSFQENCTTFLSTKSRAQNFYFKVIALIGEHKFLKQKCTNFMCFASMIRKLIFCILKQNFTLHFPNMILQSISTTRLNFSFHIKVKKSIILITFDNSNTKSYKQ